MVVQRFEDFIKSKQYDTDTLQDDMALFEDEGLSNLSIEFVNDQELLNELRAGQALMALVLALASIGAGLLASAVGYGLGTHA